MRREQRIIQHGGSAGITLDKAYLDKNGLKIGDTVEAIYGKFGNVLLIAINTLERVGEDNANAKPKAY